MPSRIVILGACLAALLLFDPSAGDEPRAGLDWWSLQPIIRPAVPADIARTIGHDENSPWVRNPIDAFVLQRLQAERLLPSPVADRTLLIRRATFDLLGLPPTPIEIDEFLSDASPEAYDKLIDRLLASPKYGERWARHWLDVARFAESQGYERDIIRDHAWRYRDYVIRSFNKDQPYDQFIREQIAGDVMEPVSSQGIIATGFLVAGAYDEAGNSSKSELLRARIREEELEDIIGTVGQTFLGLTVHCARCHDHKFDPIPQRDYYRLKAVFDGVRHGNRPALSPTEMTVHQNEVARLTRSIEALELQIAEIERVARSELHGARQRHTPSADTNPMPLARWSFECDARDEVGELHGTMRGGAKVTGGRLHLNGTGAFVQTAPLKRELQAKTLEVWVTLGNSAQRGGGLISVESMGGSIFDAIVFGEREPKKWIAGSEGYHRTKDLAAEPEAGTSGNLVHIAAVYDNDNRISLYRNGVSYADSYVPAGADSTLRRYAAGQSHVLFGLRHTGAGNGFFDGELEEARLYDRALRPDEIASSFRAGVSTIPIDQVIASLTIGQRELRASLLRDLAHEREVLQSIPPIPQGYAANPRAPEPTYVLLRGDVEKKGEQVSAGGLSRLAACLPDLDLPADAPESMRRIRFAEWVARPTNPLPARVMVNRVWHYHFGRGIVGSPSDFGWNGERPSHPDLIDWLAREFIASGWSIKQLHKLIMLSNTYRQSSLYDPNAAAIDSEARLLWRFPPRRLEGETVRDAMLAVSGELNSEMHGPSFRPFELKIFNSHFYNLHDPIGPEYNRRTVYRINVNSAKDPLLDSLDCPDPSTKTPKRTVTTTPIQALGLMNNSFVLRQARRFAARLSNDAGADRTHQIALAYRLAMGRSPSELESARALELASETGMEAVCWALFNSSEFQYLK